MEKSYGGIYIHIPFCVKKCRYCDFNSYSDKGHLINQYIDCLVQDLKMSSPAMEGVDIGSIYIGGGTPSIIPTGYIGRLVEECKGLFNTLPRLEITIEANPGTLDAGKLKYYKAVGINRLSIGLQAYQDGILQYLGRIHDHKQFEENYYTARDIGFDNISVDLMFGLPGQGMDDWIQTIEKVIALGVDHVSCYSLKIEEGTDFHSLYTKGELELPDEELDRQMYHIVRIMLKDNGYQHYEISNYSTPNKQCRHNMLYWERGEYLGVGVGAHSFIGKTRFAKVGSIDDYIRCIVNGKDAIAFEEVITPDWEIGETIILSLRLEKGIDICRFNKRFGMNFLQVYHNQLKSLMDKDLLRIEGNSIKLTERGMDLSNQVFIEFLP
ncbi:MAG TPA: oxygen-independent coproporphyrinogen III oxidase [Clostridiales bacterium]|nr:oxygen-independent coproporphyrinogen III oxidase [Clostridiales bacterium]